jgi:hypothetical protein
MQLRLLPVSLAARSMHRRRVMMCSIVVRRLRNAACIGCSAGVTAAA